MIKFNAEGLDSNKSKLIKNILDTLSFPRDSHNYEIKFKQKKFYIKCEQERFETTFSIDELMHHSDNIYMKLFPIKNSTILDCTAGLGRDGVLLSKLGHDVTMIEKNPILIIMLNNYFSRAKDIKARLLYGDSLSYIRLAKKKFDYIYIDFMFEKKNNAKPSKYDLFLRSINYNENNKLDFIKEMINYCNKRIIVKEPIKSQSKINNYDFEIKTKLIRYKIFNGKLGK